MRKIFYIVIIGFLVLTSCLGYKYASYSIVLDYRPYTSNGFFLSESNSVSFDYFPIGSVVSNSLSGTTKDGYKRAKPEDALKEFVRQCISIQSNGAVNLKAKAIFDDKNKSIIGYEVTGMAIKITDKPISNYRSEDPKPIIEPIEGMKKEEPIDEKVKYSARDRR